MIPIPAKLSPRRLSLLVFCAVLFCVALAAGPSSPARADSVQGAEAEQLLAEVERYLNGVTTLRSRFVQVTSDGAFAEGTLVLQRPNRVRFEYDAPEPVLLISDGDSFIYYDKELEQATYLTLEDTPLWFILRETVRLDDQIRVIELRRRSGTVYLTMEDARFADLGQLTLIFSERPFQLRRWEIRDPQGIVTEVALVQPSFGRPIAQQVFNFRDLPGVRIEDRLRPADR